MSRHLARDQCIHEQLSAKEAAVCVAECARIHNKSAVMPLARLSLTRAIRGQHFSPQFAARCYPPIIRLDLSAIAIFSASGFTLNAYVTRHCSRRYIRSFWLVEGYLVCSVVRQRNRCFPCRRLVFTDTQEDFCCRVRT